MRISKAFALLAVCIFVLTSCSNYDYVSKEEQAYQEEISYEAGFSDGIEFCATEYMALCYDIKVKREVLKLAQLMLGLFCCSKTISYQ